MQLSKIHHNTSQGFFWAMFFVVGGLGVALLSTLNDLLRELKKTNEHQVAYRDMWVDERQEMHDQIRADEQSRKNLFMMLSQQIAAASRGGGGGGGGVGGGHVRRVQAQPPETSEETKARMKAYIRGAAAGLPPSFGSRVGSSSGYQGPPDPEEAD